ncbi:hypothetical protein NNO_1034 [Hydrogenimonas sp.]|nr:hypothetical protein NNO_1034 [Hydrogenimonas sp.]
MPRKPRIEIPGFYHIINRGVEQRVVFHSSEDFQHFMETLCRLKDFFNVTLHNYCLMNNHYHLLIQTHKPNLSKFMRQLNSSYAIYFNKKYRRQGHLWQGRYKSWLVTDESYLFTLMRYIEQNPLNAKAVKNMEDYPYCSYRYFIDHENMPECLKESWIAENFKNDIESIRALLEHPVDKDDLLELKKASSMVDAPRIDTEPNTKKFERKLLKAKDIKERNRIIVKAYESGLSQHKIAQMLNISQPAVSGIIKRVKG